MGIHRFSAGNGDREMIDILIAIFIGAVIGVVLSVVFIFIDGKL